MDINETVIKKFHPHPLYHFVFYASGILFAVISFFVWWPLFLIGLLVFILGEVSRRAETFYILESGVAREYKMLSTSRKFLEYDKIQNIEINQSFLENMLGIGNVHMDTSGGDNTELNFKGIHDAHGVESIIREKMKAR
jgi:uncharacterized membrane protein YdbT with pleckstrin-like domain